MSLTNTEHRERVKQIVCDILELDHHTVGDTSLFTEDHGADSMQAIEILAELERVFGVTIDQTELERMVNLDGVHQVLLGALQSR